MAITRPRMSLFSSRSSLRIPPTRYICLACRQSPLRLRNAPARLFLPIQARLASSSSLPRIIQPSFWYSMVPKFLRRSDSKSKTPQEAKVKEWNPATFFILIFMLIGSQSIRMIGLRNEYSSLSQKSEAKLAVLREVIGRLQAGEDVDVEKLLGTGDATKEREWEDVLREIEEEDSLWHSRREKKLAWRARKEEAQSPSDKGPAPSATADTAASISKVPEEEKEAPRKQGSGNFY